MRLQEAGYEPPAQPEGESCAVRWLCFYALLRESNPPARLAAGVRHSLFIDSEGRLSSCGTAAEGEEEDDDESEAEELPGLLGHGEGVLQLKTPTRLPSTLGGERAIGVAASRYDSLALTAAGAGCGRPGKERNWIGLGPVKETLQDPKKKHIITCSSSRNPI